MRICGYEMLICLICIVVQWTIITSQSTTQRSANVDEQQCALAEVLIEIKNTLNTLSRDLPLIKETTTVLNAQQQYMGQKLEGFEIQLQEINETNQHRASDGFHDAAGTLNTSVQSVQSTSHTLNTQQRNVAQKLGELERNLQEINESSQYTVSDCDRDAIGALNAGIQWVRSTAHHMTTHCSRKRQDSSE
jgi:DNA repair exonuclease SbcCD ATPase subunit